MKNWRDEQKAEENLEGSGRIGFKEEKEDLRVMGLPVGRKIDFSLLFKGEKLPQLSLLYKKKDERHTIFTSSPQII